MAQVDWTVEALENVASIRAYIAQFDPDAANRVGERLLDAGNRLQRFPRKGASVGANTRKLSAVWPYLIYYSLQDEKVSILGVRHGARLAEELE